MPDVIQVGHLTKEYDEKTRALYDLTLSIRKGEWTNITGPSGSGKTTLLNIIGCLDSPSKGTVRLNGTDVTKLNQKELTEFRREHIGLIFQQYHLVPYLTALENVMIAQYFSGKVNEEDAKEMLEKVGVGHRLDHIPSHLSGGEQQRVCVARALINEPEILLADEPTGNLDQENGRIVLSLLRELHDEGHTIVMVTHNVDLANSGDRTLKLVDGKLFSDSKNGVNFKYDNQGKEGDDMNG
jgi:putative ABC transport system ATP-binding protein